MARSSLVDRRHRGLPNHLHCLWQLPSDDDDFPTRWRLIKARFSHGIDEGERISVSRQRKGERGLWQRRYWEHVIRGERDYQRHLDYIHFNPVKHGYVRSAKDWSYSSFHRWVRRGDYPVDWAVTIHTPDRRSVRLRASNLNVSFQYRASHRP
jgi:putative transposase